MISISFTKAKAQQSYSDLKFSPSSEEGCDSEFTHQFVSCDIWIIRINVCVNGHPPLNWFDLKIVNFCPKFQLTTVGHMIDWCSNEWILLKPFNVQWICLSLLINLPKMCFSDFICSPRIHKGNGELRCSIWLSLKKGAKWQVFQTRELNNKTRQFFRGKPFEKFPFIFVWFCFFGHSHFSL